jgi:hypothetical protein
MGDLRTGISTYAETSPLLVSKDVRFLAESSRLREALSALQAAAEIRPGESALAAALFQHDLWERFDALDAAVHANDGELLLDTASESDPLRLIRDEIGALMRRLALPKAAIQKLPCNLDALVRAYPELLGGLSEGKWLEVASRASDKPEPEGSPMREGTRHSMMAGFRSAFRRFVHIPENSGGSDWLRQSLSQQPPALRLPVGARAVIMEIPLVISDEGEIVPLPVIGLLEARTAKPYTDIKVPLQKLGFEALEARRGLLRAPGFPGGGLERLSFDAPFPLGGACAPNPGTLLPLRATCVMCHGPAGDTLSGTLSHGTQQLRIDRDDDLQVRVTIAAKKQRPDFAALRALFRVTE